MIHHHLSYEQEHLLDHLYCYVSGGLSLGHLISLGSVSETLQDSDHLSHMLHSHTPTMMNLSKMIPTLTAMSRLQVQGQLSKCLYVSVSRNP